MNFQNPLKAQGEIEILGGKYLFNDEVNQLTYMAGNVIFRHQGITVQCDSAIRKKKEGIVEGFGHVYIFQPDTFTLTGGDYLVYQEKAKLATVTGKEVILKDQNMTLLTTSLNYDISRQVGYYSNGADILNNEMTLKSKKGFYNRRSNVFNFKDDIKLTGKDYYLEGDTLDYSSQTHTAYFLGPSKIVSEENTVFCNYGWYNTETEKAQFSKKAIIHSKASSIASDSLLYDRKNGIGRGIGNIRLIDSTEKFTVYGQRGIYYQKNSESKVSGNPIAIQTKDEDTFRIIADTFYYKNDSLQKLMKAHGSVAILQKDVQGICDSLMYDFNDSILSLFHSPILWSEKNQITGDTMHIRMRNSKIENLKVLGNAFLAAEVKPNFYNQISGKEMVNYFDSGVLKKVLVEGNSQSIYYLRDNETDSAEYTGINKVKCGRMLIEMDSSKVSGIRFYDQPDGKMYPMKQFPESEKFLEGLVWRVNLKPVVSVFDSRTEEVIYKPVPKEEIQIKKEPSKTKKKKKNSSKSM